MRNNGKLSLDALRERVKETITEELMAKISGGTENACHDDNKYGKTETGSSQPQHADID